MTISATERDKNASETKIVLVLDIVLSTFLYGLHLFCLKTAPDQFNYFLSHTGQVFKSSVQSARLLVDRGDTIYL